MILVIGISHTLALSVGAWLVAGASWTLLNALFNVGVQLSAPRWVMGRAMSCWGGMATGGLAMGAVIWGQLASQLGIATALIISGVRSPLLR